MITTNWPTINKAIALRGICSAISDPETVPPNRLSAMAFDSIERQFFEDAIQMYLAYPRRNLQTG